MTLLAHAGGLGWDELVFLAVPVVVLALLGWQARKKADADGTADAEGAVDIEDGDH